MSPRLKRKQAEQQSLTPTGMTKAATPERKKREHSPAKLSPEKKAEGVQEGWKQIPGIR